MWTVLLYIYRQCIYAYMNDANHFVTNKMTDKGIQGLGCAVVHCIISNLSFISCCKNIWLCNYECINTSFPAQNRLSNTPTYQNTISSRWIILALSWYHIWYGAWNDNCFCVMSPHWAIFNQKHYHIVLPISPIIVTPFLDKWENDTHVYTVTSTNIWE